ncbi:hypothetical protein DMB84_000180 [Pectobacterium aquaticum]|uniref:Uncharacterized protein n=1 Tax=Pectobacterium aquaticum TaxID=2204145 RepID=A0AA93ATI2_9GAMM|nr:hypothetical protein DMB84_000180 [Pectobacterium aquaticum]
MRDNTVIFMLPRSTRPTRGGSNATRPVTPRLLAEIMPLRGSFVGIRLNGPLATRSRRGASFRRIHAAHPKPAISSA